jgi:hypothetical protein
MSYLALAAAGGSMAASTLGAISTYEQGQFANTAARRQAQILQKKSQYVQQAAGIKISTDDYNAEQLMSRIQVSAVESGVQPGQGSAKIMTELSGQQQRINDMFTKYSANVESANLQESAAIEVAQGKKEMEAADVGAITGLISGGIKSAGIYSALSTP